MTADGEGQKLVTAFVALLFRPACVVPPLRVVRGGGWLLLRLYLCGVVRGPLGLFAAVKR